NLLAQCSTALLVGVSFNWIRVSEARYRHVVEHVPVVLYSARLLRAGGAALEPQAVEITFASPAARQVLRRAPEDLLGSYQAWLDCVHPEDHELLQAALTQLSRFREPVTCEYRLAGGAARAGAETQGQGGGGKPEPGPPAPVPAADRWLRDTLV